MNQSFVLFYNRVYRLCAQKPSNLCACHVVNNVYGGGGVGGITIECVRESVYSILQFEI